MDEQGIWILFAAVVMALLLYVLAQYPGEGNVSILGPPQEQRTDWVQNCLGIITQNGTVSVALTRNLILTWTEPEAAQYTYEHMSSQGPGFRKYERCWVEAEK